MEKFIKKHHHLISPFFVFSLFALIFIILILLANYISSKQILISTNQARNALQLSTFIPNMQPPKPTTKPGQAVVPPPPTAMCEHDNGVRINIGPNKRATCSCSAFLFICENKKCIYASLAGQEGREEVFQHICGEGGVGNTFCGGTDGELTGLCVGKPVIYLYPVEKTVVDVEVKTPGEIVTSDPHYPEGGWKNVEANPDGTLFYEGKGYRELFYETEVEDFLKPRHGIIIATKDIESRLKIILADLGLNTFEANEFMEFWVPRLYNLNSNYILFSLLEKDTKEAIDHVAITPEPDTRIEFIAYFKALNTLEPIKPLKLPQKPVRRGFTMVEWGGVID